MLNLSERLAGILTIFLEKHRNFLGPKLFPNVFLSKLVSETKIKCLGKGIDYL